MAWFLTQQSKINLEEEKKKNLEEESKSSNINLMSGDVVQSEKEKNLLPAPYYAMTSQEPQVSVQSLLNAKPVRKTTDDNRSSASEEILDNSK